MPYRVLPGETARDALRRVVSEQTKSAVQEAAAAEHNLNAAVHQSRKRTKKVRAALRLLRPVNSKLARRANEVYRDAARLIAPLRDTQSLIESFDRLVASLKEDQRRKLGPVRELLTGHQEQVKAQTESCREVSSGVGSSGEDSGHALVVEFGETMKQMLDAIPDWDLEDFDRKSWLKALTKEYESGRKLRKRALATKSAEDLHEWRKKVKLLWYYTRLLVEVWPPVMKALEQEWSRLADLLGQEHDIEMLYEHFVPVKPEWAAIENRIALLLKHAGRQKEELIAEADRLSQELYRLPGESMARVFELAWDASWSED